MDKGGEAADNPTKGSGEEKLEQISGFPCKSCGAALEYAPGSTRMECPYCGTENEIDLDFDPGEVEEEHELEDLPPAPATTQTGMEVEQRTFKCRACGAIQSVETKTIATQCAYCDSDTIIEQPSNPDLIRPSGLVPFAFNKEAAVDRYRQWLSSWWRKLFAPKALSGQAAMTKLQGIYTPFFTFDAQAESDWSGYRGDYYYVTVGSGDNKRRVRKTRWTHRRGHHSHFYDDVLVYASSGLPEKTLNKIEPFHTSKLEPFAGEYLAGFSAEEYTNDPKVMWGQARNTMKNAEHQACRRALGGDTQRGLRVRTRLLEPTWKHILLPIYLANYLYGTKQYHFLINGQTGEVQGSWPIHWGKVAAAVGAIVAAVLGIAVATGSI